MLIPTYNRPHYLELAVQSVLMQTYKKIEIIITDNSTNLESQARLAPYLEKHPQIKYVKNERDLGYVENCQRGFALASGDYINYLMDDDLFCREKIEKMLSFYLQHADITLVTSYRQLMDEAGNPLAPIAATRKLFEETAMLDGKVLGNFVLSNCLNVIGEPTTVLFRRKDLERFGAYKGKSYKMLIDVASWMSLLSKGNAVYISETLSQFRLHSNQSQKSISTSVSAIQEWLDLIRDARAEGFLDHDTAYKTALNQYLTHCSQIIQQAIHSNDCSILKTNRVGEILGSCIAEIVG
ncbi:glycosyltransferase [Fodinisporobacter ferrooxydans]|uniref:Glycosyltransferase n=1 Tax=Fodinisporobacter ferrooxydans TaxID=2901836 RepID=A0ABY4CQS9_9BACL|nr:glycosyltransferase [Alicyclobacillaceae bacterium MYW30-H2]